MAPWWSCGRRCVAFLVAALALDAAGLALVLAGAVARPARDGESLEDFLVLTGALLLFLSLLCWLFWYSGNLRGLPAAELPLGPGSGGTSKGAAARRSPAGFLRLAAKLSERLSQRRRPEPGLPSPPAPAAKASRMSPAALELSSLRSEKGTPQERLV